ncbi:MAG TPA: FtsX-like permease family protein [Bryobacterales bacterium]|nr:FtsX-like permease family protein [Bryobacterales bacterium]
MTARLLLFYRLILRPLAREPLRTALTIFAVALGVAVVVAIDLAGVAAAGSFRSSLETLAGRTDLELSAAGGLDESLLARLVQLPYPLRFRPRIDDFAQEESSGRTVPVVGLDLIAESELAGAEVGPVEQITGGVWVGPRLARAPGAKLRLTLNDRSREFTVRGVLHLEGLARFTQDDLVVMDIATAQEALGKAGRLDRIEVLLPPGADVNFWEQKLRPELPAGVTVQRPGARSEENQKMLSAFRWNLRVLSYISLVVGAFLIYNTIGISVVRRRAEIGVMRALGATRGGVLAAFLAEAAFFGAAGSLLGLALGRLLAAGAVQLLASTVQALYVSSRPAPIEWTTTSLLLGAGLGLGVALLSALAPAREATQVPPTEAMARGLREYHARIHWHRDLLAATALSIAAAIASRLPPVEGKPVFGYVATFLLVAASALAAPALVLAVARFTRSAFGVEGTLAVRSLAASLNRTSVMVGALSTAVAMMASVGIMVGSFRQTVLLWMDNQLRADLYLRPAGRAGAGQHPTLDPAVADRIESLSGVDAVDRFRAYEISFGGLPCTLAGGETRIVSRFGRLRFLPGQNRAAILAELPQGDSAIISEPFAIKHHLRAGDSIELPLAGTPRRFHILGVYYDYSSERGFIILDRGTLLRYLPDLAPSNLAVYVKPGAGLDQVRREVEQAIAGHRILITSNRSLRAEAIRTFDRTFAITYALEAVAILVAILGVAGALLALVIDRRRELGLLRFLGASAVQVRRLLFFEAGLLGLLANLLGLALGALLSLILIFVINKQSFGWTIQFHWPVALLAAALTLIYAATLAAAWLPARAAARLNPIEVVHEE